MSGGVAGVERSGQGIRRLRRGALIAACAGSLALAVVLGWFLHDWLGSDRVVVSADRPVQVYAPETVTAGEIPNVIGLAEDEARRVLSDAGADLSLVGVEEIPYVGPSDLVVEQEPAPGGPLGDRPIELVVSVPASMPELDGLDEAEAREALTELGAPVTVVHQYQPGAAEGRVLSTEPAVGEEIPGRVTLHVAEPLSSVFLTQLEPTASTCRTAESALLVGAEYQEAIVCLPQSGAKPRGVTYALGGAVESFEAELGLDDRGDPDVPVAFRIYVDGNLALSRQLEYGDSLPVEVPLLDKLQLTLETTVIGEPEPGSLPVRAAFGDPQLVGSRSAVDGISEGLAE